MENTITIKLPIVDEFINDVLCTALDSAYGGSLYWVEKTRLVNGTTKEDYGIEYKYEVVTKDGTLLVYADEEMYELTRERFLKGFQMWVEQRLEDQYSIPRDAGDIDANDADSILQYALFNELRYS